MYLVQNRFYNKYGIESYIPTSNFVLNVFKFKSEYEHPYLHIYEFCGDNLESFYKTKLVKVGYVYTTK